MSKAAYILSSQVVSRVSLDTLRHLRCHMGRRDLTGGVLWWLTWKRWSLEGLESSKPLPAPAFPRLSFSTKNFDLPRLKWKRSGNVRFFPTSCGPCVGVASSSGATWSVASFSAWPWCFSRLAPLPASKNGSRSSDVEVWAACFPSHLLASRYWVVRWQGWSKYHGFNPIVSHRPMTFPVAIHRKPGAQAGHFLIVRKHRWKGTLLLCSPHMVHTTQRNTLKTHTSCQHRS